MIEEILCVARQQIRSIVDLCEEFGDRSKVQNLPIKTIFTPLYSVPLSCDKAFVPT